MNNTNKTPHSCERGVLFGGSGWIRTTEVSDNRFTVCPLWPLGNAPIWSWWSESNQQPADYKSASLPLSHNSILRCFRNIYIIPQTKPFIKRFFEKNSIFTENPRFFYNRYMIDIKSFKKGLIICIFFLTNSGYYGIIKLQGQPYTCFERRQPYV